MAEAVVERLYPAAKGKIAEVASLSSFKGSDGSHWHGITVTIDNGEEFTVWNQSQEILAQFVVGQELTYTRKLVSKNGKETFKLVNHAFPVPRVERFEPLVVGKIADAVTFAASYAKDMCVAENDITNFETYATRMHQWMKTTLLTETFEL